MSVLDSACENASMSRGHDPNAPPLRIIYRGHDQAGFFAHGVGLQGGPHPLHFPDGNQRPDHGHYVCIVVLNDYMRMLREYTDREGLWHYSDLEAEIQEDLRMRRAVLVFDLSNEGPAYAAAAFHPLYQWLAAQRIPAQRCIWLAQNRAMAAQAAADSHAPTPGIQFLHYDFFVKIAAWILSPRSTEPVFGADWESYDAALFDSAAKDRLLLCLNATPRLHRILVVAGLLHHGWLPECLVSFPGLDYVKPGSSVEEVQHFLDIYPRFHWLRSAVDQVLSMPALRADAFCELGNDLVGKVDLHHYTRTYFSLVTETEFTDGSVDRITEKTVKAYGMGHPTLIVGNPGALRFVTDLGFQDWSGVFDCAFDIQPDPADRFEAVFREIERQQGKIAQDPAAWLREASAVGRYNLEHARSGGFLKAAITAIDRPAIEAIRQALG
jgi:hypothetical protein